MATPTEILQAIIDGFERSEAIRLDIAIERALLSRGSNEYAAGELAASEALQGRVLQLIDAHDSRTLPFVVAGVRVPRLVGTARTGTGVPDAVRERLSLGSPEFKMDVARAVYGLGAELFVCLCCRILSNEGAGVARKTGNTDEGGIDMYGRLSLRIQDPDIDRRVLRTTVLHKSFLFLGQCKCWNPDTMTIGPGELDKLNGAVVRCVDKYVGERHPPSNRVPGDFYDSGETAIKLFLTTTRFTTKAKGAGRDVVLVDGVAIAEFLISNGVGVSKVNEEPVVSPDVLAEWAANGCE
jgi:hypothetical protein